MWTGINRKRFLCWGMIASLIAGTLIPSVGVAAENNMEDAGKASSNKIYTDLEFGNPQAWGLSYRKENGNSITWEEEENGNGYLKLAKTNVNDMYMDVNLQLSSNHVVFEQDIYLEEEHPKTILFYFRDTVTIGSNVNVGMLEVENNTVELAGQTVTLALGEWHRVSAVMDFENCLCDIYMDGTLAIADVSFNENLKNPTLWRIYVSGGENYGTFYSDNLRVYDGMEPRDIEWEQEYQLVYSNLKFDDSQEWGVSYQKPNRNSITWAEEESGNGYLKLEKNTTDDMYIDINNHLALSSDHVVFEQDIYLEEEHPDVLLFYLRDTVTAGSQVNVGILEIKSNTAELPGQTVTLASGEWHRVSAVMDFENCLCDIYVDGTLAVADVSFNENLKSPSLWRIYVNSGEKNGAFYIDNLKVYDGMGLRDINAETVEEKNVFIDQEALAILNGKTALSPYAGVLYVDGQKVDVEDSVIMERDEALVTPEVMERLFGETVRVNGNIATIGDSVILEAGKKEIFIGGSSMAIDTAPRMENDILWLPVCAYGENVLPEGCFMNDGHGMFLVSNQAVSTSDTRLKEANLYLFFERKSAEEWKELLLKTNGEDLAAAHPRILATANDFERLREEIEEDTTKAEWFASIRRSADTLLEQPPLSYVISNNRLLDVANSALSRVGILGMVWQITGEQRYADRLIAELEAIGSFQDWHPKHTLDTGTMAMAAALGYDWAYDAMTEEQRQRIGGQFWSLGLETAHAAYYGTASYPSWWTNTETNWGGVVNAGFLNLALALAEFDTDYAMDIASNAKRSMEYTIYRIAPDGAWYEGPSYWQYFFQFLSYAMAGYESAMGETDETLSFMGMEGFAKYQMYFSDPSGNVNNFHDSEEGAIGSYGQFYLARKLDMPELAKYRVNFMEQQNQAPTIYDLLWYDVDTEDSFDQDSLALDGYYRETEFFSMRQNWEDENALWVSAHGGSTNSAHDHIDSGTFVMNLGGVRWAIDLPKEMLSYVSDAENPSIQAGYDSYYFYRRKGEGHNIVVINPDANLEMDQSQFAGITKMVSGIGRSYAVVDLSGAYRSDVNSYLRGYLLSEGRRAFTVRDEIDLKADDSELYWFMHTEGQVVILDDHTAVILQDGKQLKVQFLTDAADSELSVMAAEKFPQSPQFTETANPTISKLAWKLTASGKVNITVKMSLIGESASLAGPENVPIAEWTVEGDDTISREGETSRARLSEIRINGDALTYFNPETFYYEYSLRESEEEAQVMATGDGRIEVVSYSLEDERELQEVRVYDGQGKYTSYVIKIEPYSPYSQSQYLRHEVVEVWASSEQTSESNYCVGSCDGDLSTRWSADGVGEWLIHDLGEVKTIDAFGVALWKGHERTFYFDLEVSEDGVNFTPVITGYESCGTTEDIEVIPLEQSVTGRYVRYVGYGNSINAWNNVIELASYIKRGAGDDGGDTGEESVETPGGGAGEEDGETSGGDTGEESVETPGGEGSETPGGESSENTGGENTGTPDRDDGGKNGDNIENDKDFAENKDDSTTASDSPRTGDEGGEEWVLFVIPLMLACILALVGLRQMEQRFFGRR